MFSWKYVNRIVRMSLAVAVAPVGVVVADAQNNEAEAVSDLPTITELVQSYVEFNGGRSNMAQIQSLIVSGEMHLSEGEVRRFKLIKKRPLFLRLQIEYDQGTVTTYFDGENVWRKYENSTGEHSVEDLTEQQLAAYIAESPIEGPFYQLSRDLNSIESIEEDEVNGMPAYKVTVAANIEFSHDTIWLSQEHFQEIKLKRHFMQDGEAVVEETYMLEHEKADGVYYAIRTVVYRDGVVHSSLTVDRVRTNVGVFDRMFRP
ncbi:MAG: hypothetical protein AAGC73_04005 [Verrucomicrobiota bacterium]